jgi:hypothetical protein
MTTHVPVRKAGGLGYGIARGRAAAPDRRVAEQTMVVVSRCGCSGSLVPHLRILFFCMLGQGGAVSRPRGGGLSDRDLVGISLISRPASGEDKRNPP